MDKKKKNWEMAEKRDSIIELGGKRQIASLHTRRSVGQLML